MNIFKRLGIVYLSALLMMVFTLSVVATADGVKVAGFIKARNGPTMLVQTSDGMSVTVLLDDNTDVGQVEGMLKARHKEMSMAALVPGLRVKVEGLYNEQKQLVASKIRFKGSDLKHAQAVQAGMHESQQALKKQQEELKAHNEALQAHQQQLNEQQAKLAEHRAAIDAAVARFGQLDDYYIFDEVTIYFANGKTSVDPKYVPQLMALCQKAKAIEGYMIEVKGYASPQGSTALNQRLSEGRAGNVTNILLQQGRVPLTRMLAPGAMGESEQVGNTRTVEGQARNRRVVVRVLQNKAIAGL